MQDVWKEKFPVPAKILLVWLETLILSVDFQGSSHKKQLIFNSDSRRYLKIVRIFCRCKTQLR